jgi:polar amino acid transport system permease protein
MIRNTPLLVQLFVVFFGLPSIGIKLDVIPVATIGLAINLGAYASEIIRAGIESIPKSQVEAAVALGLTGRQVFRHIILVPALKNVYPSLTSQFILLMLATSVASQIAAPELFYAGSIIQSRTYRDFEVYTIIAVAYLALALLLRVVFALCYRLLVRRR